MNEAATFVGGWLFGRNSCSFERVEPKTEEFVKQTCILTKHVTCPWKSSTNHSGACKDQTGIGIAMDGKSYA